jgi:DNA replication and repair protein RecF
VQFQELTVRRFRNLKDTTLKAGPEGALLIGANGEGKTSLLEAIYFPVLFRSLRGASDQEIVRFGEPGFHVGLRFEAREQSHHAAVTYRAAGRKKEHVLDGEPLRRLADGAGIWMAVAFLPEDVRLASGPAAGRRLFLDRTLALADRGYFTALATYRHALGQRNAALRSGRIDLARAFDAPLSRSGARVIAGRLTWVEQSQAGFRGELVALGEPRSAVELSYAGPAELADAEAWPAALDAAAARDLARGATTVGPHRDDLQLCLEGHGFREFGSTGQQRSAAIALKLLELETLRRAAGEAPALLLDDVFAELDQERQERLATRLRKVGQAQVFITSPRADELGPGMELPVWRVGEGEVRAED